MNMVFLKRALGLASAMVLMGALALAASPVQASDVDARIQVLERELAQLKQNQEAANERALAAEAKGPSFNYAQGRGLTIAAADNNWSFTFGQRLQLYTSLWLTNDDPEAGYQNGVIRIRRFRPHINVTSQQGFYEATWQFSGDASVAFDGDLYIHFEQMSPYLPTLGLGYNPGINGNRENGFGRTEDSLFVNALAMGGAQDRSVVLRWRRLPTMGIARINHFDVAWGLDQQDEYARTPHNALRPHGDNLYEDRPILDGSRSTAVAFGIQPVAEAKGMGGFDISSLRYALTWASMKNLSHGPGNITTPTTQERVTLVSAGDVNGDHTYMYHNVTWSPLPWFAVSGHHADYKADAESGAADDIEATEVRLATRIWLWSPASGIMSGSRVEGGIYIAPMYSVTKLDTMDAVATNHGISVNYNVPGGWMQIRGVWDRFGCEGEDCEPFDGRVERADGIRSPAIADEGKDDFDVFTLIVEYRF